MLASKTGPPALLPAAARYGKSPALAPGRRRWYAWRLPGGGVEWLRSYRWWTCGRWLAAFPAEGYRLLYPGSLALFGFIGFSVLKIPDGWSNPLYLAPLFVSVVLTYGMFWFVWAYFGALIAFACLAGPYRARRDHRQHAVDPYPLDPGFVAFVGEHPVRRHGGPHGRASADGRTTRKVLQPDETVKVVGRLHWSIYGRGVDRAGDRARRAARSPRRLPDPDWQHYARAGGWHDRRAGDPAAAGCLDPPPRDRDRGDRSARHLQARPAVAPHCRDERQQDRDGGCRAEDWPAASGAMARC